MFRPDLTIDELVERLTYLPADRNVCVLDSCGVQYQGSKYMFAGVAPVDTCRLSGEDAESTLSKLDDVLQGDLAAIFTISYDLGPKLARTRPARLARRPSAEPDVWVARFDSLIVHDHETRKTALTGNSERFAETAALIDAAVPPNRDEALSRSNARSNFTRDEYIRTVEEIKEFIRRGDTYQTNLTQQITVRLAAGLSAPAVYSRLRRDHPAAFSAYIERGESTVVSASPERFFKLENGVIQASPIKGTRPRGQTPEADARLRSDLVHSGKDRAENTMIVDLLRNDLGRICDYGTVNVESLCEIEEHPTLFHLVSRIKGRLREGTRPGEIVRALFPCGSITGAPKIRTMQIIEELERSPRGLSMGAIGCFIPEGYAIEPRLETSVAIRTMVVCDGDAVFNVGGGIVIDSEPDAEYEESLVKAKALLTALGTSANDLV